MNTQQRLMLSAVSEAVLVLAGRLDLVDYGHWEYLLDFVAQLHEELNDMKPSYSRVSTPEE